jgi:hypothetical protein
MKLNNQNKINSIKSNVIHKSESELTVKNELLSASNQKMIDNPINKPLKEDVANFNAPLSRRQSEKVLISINNAKNPQYNQALRTPSNSKKNLIEIPKNKSINFDDNDTNNNKNFINLDYNNNNFKIRYSNNSISNLNNNLNSNNLIKQNSYSNNNIINLNKPNNGNNQNHIPFKTFQNAIYANERVFRSNNNISNVRKNKNLLGVESTMSKPDNNMKSRSNPLLQYVTIGIKSHEEYKRQNTDINLSSNRSSRRKNANSVNKNDNSNNNVNAFTVYASENSKKFFGGNFGVKENYKTIIALFLLLGGSAFFFKLYPDKTNLFADINNLIKSFVPQKVAILLSYYFNADFIKNNILSVCILTASLIALVFVFLKYREHVRFSKIAEKDYALIKQILDSSRHKEDNCDLIGLFKNNFVKDNSERHKISQETYRRHIMPIMQEARLKEDLIEEGEILIQDQVQKVWRFRKSINIDSNANNHIFDDHEMANDI